MRVAVGTAARPLKNLTFAPQSLRRAGVSLLLAVVLMLAYAVPARASGSARKCSAAPVAGSYSVSLQSGGLTRTALVYVPAGIRAGARVPLVVAVHGAYGNGPFMQSYSGFSKLADRYRFIVAYPTAAGHFWNISASPNRPDDVAFIGSLITSVESANCIDRTRVYATGVSNGGGMVALLGCELSTRLAGIAAVAGLYDSLPRCHLGRPVPLLEIHGTADQIAAYDGPSGHAAADGLPPFVAGWAQRDSCVGTLMSHDIAKSTILFTFGGCAGGAIVEHIRIIGGRHQWPGATPPDPGPPATICAACTVWHFFSMLGRRAKAQGGGGGAPI